MAVPSESNRNARLDQLSAAVTAWADQRQRYLENQVAFARKVLRGRTGAERLNGTTSAQAQSLVVDEIDQFLTGG